MSLLGSREQNFWGLGFLPSYSSFFDSPWLGDARSLKGKTRKRVFSHFSHF
jgi:hypothetical protein